MSSLTPGSDSGRSSEHVPKALHSAFEGRGLREQGVGYHDAIQFSDGFHDDDIMIDTNAPILTQTLGRMRICQVSQPNDDGKGSNSLSSVLLYGTGKRRYPACHRTGDLPWPFSSQLASAGKPTPSSNGPTACLHTSIYSILFPLAKKRSLSD